MKSSVIMEWQKTVTYQAKTTKILTFKSVGSKDVTLNCVPYHFSSWSVCPWNFLDTTITLHISNSTLWRLVIKILYSQPKALIIIKIHFIRTFIIQLTWCLHLYQQLSFLKHAGSWKHCVYQSQSSYFLISFSFYYAIANIMCDYVKP